MNLSLSDQSAAQPRLSPHQRLPMSKPKTFSLSDSDEMEVCAQTNLKHRIRTVAIPSDLKLGFRPRLASLNPPMSDLELMRMHMNAMDVDGDNSRLGSGLAPDSARAPKHEALYVEKSFALSYWDADENTATSKATSASQHGHPHVDVFAVPVIGVAQVDALQAGLVRG